jgi:hypothetical protein
MMPLRSLLTLAVLFWCSPVSSLLALPTRPPDQQLPTFAPIQAEGSQLTEAHYRDIEQRWKELAFLTPLAEASAQASWFPTASALLTEAVQLQTEAGVLPFSLAPLAERFRSLMKNEPTAPLIRILAAQSIFDADRDWREPASILAPVIDFPDLSPWLRAQALQLHVDLLKRQGGDYRFPRGALVDTLIEILAASDLVSSTPIEVMVRQQISFLTAAEVTLDTYLIRWLEAVEASVLPDWAKLSLLGFGEIEMAWLRRSSKWASEVTDEQWQGFVAHLTKAREHLQKAWEMVPARPEAAAHMITVAMGDSLDENELRLWFDRSVQAQFDYYPAYNKMLWALRPRWCGSHQHMLAFGLACASTKRFDTGVPAYLFHAAQDITLETRDLPGVFADVDSKTAMLETAAAYIEEAPSPSTLPHRVRQTVATISAWLAGDPTLAAKGFAGIGNQFSPHGQEFLSVLLLHESQFRAETAAGSGQFGPQVQAFAALSKDRQTEEWANALAAIPLDDLSPEARQYVEEWRDWQDLTEQLETGEWIPWTPRSYLTTLTSTGGRWQVEDGALLAIGDDTLDAALLLPGLAGIPLEIRAEVEVSELTPSQPSPQGWSFGFTHDWRPSSSSERSGGLCLAIQSKYSDVFEAIMYHRRPSQPSHQQPLSSRNPFALQSWAADGAFSFAMNSQWLFERQLDPTAVDRDSKGSPGFITNRLPFGMRLVFRNIAFKKAGPSPAITDAQPAPSLTPAQAPTSAPPFETSAATRPVSQPVLDTPQPPPVATTPFPIPLKALLLGAVILLAILVHFWVERKKAEPE